jgi:predicted nucleic acid-binding protein
MKSIVFDAGPIISLTTNNLLWILEKLKDRYNGDFIIPRDVQFELVQRPIETKRFKLEALQVNSEIRKGTLKVVENADIDRMKSEILHLANSCFLARGYSIKLVHDGEVAALAAALFYDAEAVVIDERTMRDIIENPDGLARHMSDKLHTKVSIDRERLDELLSRIGKIKVIRSIELAIVGYELGWFDEFLTQDRDAKKTLIEAILWGIKVRGASISQDEIDRIVRLEK